MTKSIFKAKAATTGARFHMVLPDDTLVRARAAAKASGLSVSELMRQSLEFCLKREGYGPGWKAPAKEAPAEDAAPADSGEGS